MAPAGFLNLVEMLRKREVPGAERREAERQAAFEARYCETETDYCSTKSDQLVDSEEDC